MSSRALRRLREEKEAAALLATTNEEKEEGDDESFSSEEETTGGGGGFMMMLDDDDDEESERESDEISHDDGDDGDSENEKKTMNNITKNATPRKKKAADKKEEDEEDLDAILSDMNIIQQGTTDRATIDSAASANIEQNVLPTTIRQLLLSTNNKNGYDVQDLDLDNAMRSLLGGENDPFLTSQISLLLLRWQSQQRQAIT